MKTTIYLPDDLKAALHRRSIVERRSESEIIREAIEKGTAGYWAPSPCLPLGVGRGPADLSEHVDEMLDGIGEQ